MKRITIEVTPEIHAKLKSKTALEGVSIKSVISQFINNYINNFKNGK
jgi:predicted HicB family RNase H-like nuclease